MTGYYVKGVQATHVNFGLPDDVCRRLGLLAALKGYAEEGEHSLFRRREEVAGDEPDGFDVRLLCNISPDTERYSDDLADRDKYPLNLTRSESMRYHLFRGQRVKWVLEWLRLERPLACIRLRARCQS